MKRSADRNHDRCLEMLRRFADNFDTEAARWLADRSVLVEEFMVARLDDLKPPERLKLYVLLFGFFRNCYRRVIEARLQLEEDPKCREVLRVVEEQHRAAIQDTYLPIT